MGRYEQKPGEPSALWKYFLGVFVICLSVGLLTLVSKQGNADTVLGGFIASVIVLAVLSVLVLFIQGLRNKRKLRIYEALRKVKKRTEERYGEGHDEDWI